MKKIIACFVIAITVASVTTVFAQSQGGGGQKGQMQQMMRQRLKDSLQLSDAMTDSVMAVHREFLPKEREVRQNQSLSEDQKKQQLEDLRKQMEARYKKIGLTDDQIKRLAVMDKNMRDRMQNRNGGSKK